jgi:Cu/Ag efflux protein CusF
MGAISVQKLNYIQGPVTTLDLGSTSLGSTTEDGISVEATNNNMARKSDQAQGVVTSKLIDREVHVKMTLAECTLANMVVALNLASSALSGCTLTVADTEATDAALVVVGVAPNAKTRTMIFDAVKSVGNFAMAIGKLKEMVFAIDFLVMWNAPNNRYFICGDSA